MHIKKLLQAITIIIIIITGLKDKTFLEERAIKWCSCNSQKFPKVCCEEVCWLQSTSQILGQHLHLCYIFFFQLTLSKCRSDLFLIKLWIKQTSMSTWLSIFFQTNGPMPWIDKYRKKPYSIMQKNIIRNEKKTH